MSHQVSNRVLSPTIPKIVWLLFGAAFVFRALVTILFGDNTTFMFEYMTIAQNMLDGKGYSFDEWQRTVLQPTSFLPPLYVYWCYFFLSFLQSDYTWMYIAQALVAASAVFPAYLIGKTYWNNAVGVTFAAAVAFYPEFAYLHTRPVTEFLYLVCALWLVYGYLLLNDRARSHKGMTPLALGVGLLAGVTTLIKESAVLFVFAICVALLYQQRREIKTVLRAAVIPIGLAACVVMSPWIVRNWLVQGEFIPIRTGYGLTAWLANHPGASGAARTASGEAVHMKLDSAYQAHMDSILPPDEQDRDKVYKAEVRRFISEHPDDYLRLTWIRLKSFVLFDETHPIAKNIVYRMGWITLLIASIWGWIIARKKKKLDPVIPITLITMTLLYVPVLVLPRYRLIPAMLLLLLASIAALDIWRRVNGKDYLQISEK